MPNRPFNQWEVLIYADPNKTVVMKFHHFILSYAHKVFVPSRQEGIDSLKRYPREGF